VILILIALPSFALLYAMDDVGEPLLTIKVIGHQWYWSYEVVTPRDHTNAFDDAVVAVDEGSADPMVRKAFDAYMVLEEDLEVGQFRLLETDNNL